MIAKRISRSAAASSYGRLGAYILDGPGPSGANMGLTAGYILDIPGGRASCVRVSNCLNADPHGAIREITAVQAMNTRAKGDKTYHLVVSFPAGERPGPEQLSDIEDELCAAIGLAGHQRISAMHTDTDHLHMHVAINLVHPQSFCAINPYYDRPRLMAACERLEIKHNLTRTFHGAKAEHQPETAAEMEAHAGVTSFLRWVRETAGAAIKQSAAGGEGWQALHEKLAAFDLEIRPRGAGLIIAARDGSVAVKASSVDRALAFQALTKRWGAYVPPEKSAAAAPEKSYRKEPLNGSQELYADYLRQRAAAQEARVSAQAALRLARRQYVDDLRAWYGKASAALRQDRSLKGQTRRDAYKRLHERRSADFAAHQCEARAALAGVWRDHPLPTWQGFLQDAAARGDGRALHALRRRQTRYARAASDLLRAENPSEARHVVFTRLRPHTRKNGDIVYRVKDGGLVVDGASAIRVEELTLHAAFLALSLAGERFAGQALIVDGSDEFKRQIAEMAGAKRLDVRFADPNLDETRERHAANTAPPADALAAFIASRNALREKIPAIAPHRAWTPDDAGQAVFEGRRTLKDGLHAVLLRKGDGILVMGVANLGEASGWKRGQAVITDADGRLQAAGKKRGR